MARVDEIDTLILRELLKDARKSFIGIAKQCNLTKGAIAKRYDEMKKANIIVGSTIQFNYPKFGYSAVAFMLISVESRYADSLFAYLNTLPGMRNYRCYSSTHNIIVVAKLKTLRSLEQVKDLICGKCPINEIKTYLWIDVRNIPENILPNTFKNKTKTTQSIESGAVDKKDSVKLDELDMQIIEKLTINGRISFRKIAQELGTTTYTIARRYKNLTKNNYIKPSIQINTINLGFQAILHFHLTLNKQNKTNMIADELSKILGVTYLVKISGDYDLQVAALVKDYVDGIRIYEEIAKNPEIKKIVSMATQLRPVWPSPRQYISTF